MTHLFECSTNEYNLISNGEKRFDILKFGKVSIGDTIIYQRLADTEDEETKEGEVNDTPFTDDEYSVVVDFILSDDDALKKGFAAVSFKPKVDY